MSAFKMEMNPFSGKEETNYSEEALKELYQQLKAGNAKARSLIMAPGSKFVEAIILELQHFNIPEKYTFTALYQIGMAELAKIIDNDSFDQYRRFVVWCIRQRIKNTLMDKN